MDILVTGGCGFIGTNFIKYWKSIYNNSKIINIDNLTYAGNSINLNELKDYKNYQFIKADISDSDLIKKTLYINKPDFIVNFAAESHVDRSIIYPDKFFETNVIGTFKLLKEVNNYFHKLNIEKKKKFRFMHISTDEVYGSLQEGDLPFNEKNKYYPNSPYSASKASSDHIVRSFFKTYNLPVLVSNCSNNYGPYQSIEKLIPLIICNALRLKDIPIYGNGQQIRDWLYVGDHCEAINIILLKGTPGEVYNIGSSNEIRNIEIASFICKLLDEKFPKRNNQKVKSYYDLINFTKDRPGHDYRYSIDSSKLKNELGWEAKVKFEDGILKTINWYINNQDWLSTIFSKDYENWFKIQYEK